MPLGIAAASTNQIGNKHEADSTQISSSMSCAAQRQPKAAGEPIGADPDSRSFAT